MFECVGRSIFNFILLQTFADSLKNIPQTDLNKYLQPMYVGVNSTYDQISGDEFVCSRDCTLDPDPKICYYKFVIEQYHVMGPACDDCPLDPRACYNLQCIQGDGIERTVLSINRMLPGPAIHVCYGDRIIVDVHNKMPARDTSLHWHGELQEKSPWMDGVPFVTQCPIPENTKFRYDFQANTPGSHFYHSHSGFQLFEGALGALIVRVSKKIEPIANLYDEDLFSHTIIIQDWGHMLMDNKYPGANKNLTLISTEPHSFLINGRGAFINTDTMRSTGTPFTEFKVRSNRRYRFRILTIMSTTCSGKLTFEGHKMLLVATDGYPVQPVEIRNLYLVAGDVHDVVITTDQEPRPYWIRVQGVGNCTAEYQYGILSYEEISTRIPSTPNTEDLFNVLPYPELNDVRLGCKSQDDNLCMDEIRSIYEAPPELLAQPDKQFYLEIQAHLFTNEELYQTNRYQRNYLPVSGRGVHPLGGPVTDAINNITNILPPFPLLTQPEDPIPAELICPEKCFGFCECLHLIKLPLNSVVELILVDALSTPLLPMDHSMHIHGHHFSIFKLGTKEEMKNPDFYKDVVKTNYPVIKNNVAIPAGGFAVVRFLANNPGFWSLHCHFTFHNHNGMVVIFQVGERNEFRHYPADWPKCNDYLPPV